MNIGYKLLTQDMTSHGGLKWKLGEAQTAEQEGTRMCSAQVLHFYNHPLMAVMFNPIHASIDKPRLFKIETSEIVAQDELKFACKSQTLVEELMLPSLSPAQKQYVAINCAKQLANPSTIWLKWADNWLSNIDRSIESEKHAHAQVHVHANASASASASARAHAHAHAYTYACACACACACRKLKNNTVISFLEASLLDPTL